MGGCGAAQFHPGAQQGARGRGCRHHSSGALTLDGIGTSICSHTTAATAPHGKEKGTVAVPGAPSAPLPLGQRSQN